MAIYYIYNQTFLGFYTPSSQMQVKDKSYSFITKKIIKLLIIARIIIIN